MALENKNIKFRLIKITTEQFAIISESFNQDKPVKVNSNVKFGFNIENRFIAASTKFSFYTSKNPFIIIEITCHFEIDTEDWKILFKDEDLILPIGLASHLITLTIGTARGILYGKLEETALNNFIIPLIDVSTIIKSDVVVSVNTEIKKSS